MKSMRVRLNGLYRVKHWLADGETGPRSIGGGLDRHCRRRGAPGGARQCGWATAGIRVSVADAFIVVLIRKPQCLAPCPGSRRAGGSIDALTGSSTSAWGVVHIPGSATGRMDAAPDLRLPGHPLFASGPPFWFHLTT